MKDCAGFERELTALAGGDVPQSDRSAALARLRGHAAACAQCGSAADLVALLAEPPGERDLPHDPGDEYWAGFQARLERRIAAEPSGAGRARPARYGAWVAAALLLVAAASWLALRPGPDPSRPGADSATVATDDEPLPAGSAEWYEGLDDLAGFGVEWTDDDAGDLFPDVSGLDAPARRELLNWLEEQSS